jgi:hypothetical protein
MLLDTVDTFLTTLDYLCTWNLTNFKKYSLLINFIANYEGLKASVAKNGEVMIRLDTGEKIELHIHNVKFEDATKEIMVDAGTETYWIGADNASIAI